MRKAKIFISGNSQAVRIPQDLQFQGKEVEIIKSNNEIILREIPENLSQAYQLLTELSVDFLENGRADQAPQKRELF